MCGVVALLNRDGQPAQPEPLGRMLGQISHRGPDAFGTYCDASVGLGHVRLSIIDLQEGHQPFARGNKAITYNGEIYNYIELRQELISLGETFRTQSDTEVLLVALIRWGVAALPRCNGQFAFVFWDGEKRTLLAGRDRYGVRPLYFTPCPGGYAFSSEMKAFDEIPGFQRCISPEHLLEHGLFWNTLGDRTIYQGIRSVEPGTVLIFEGQREARSQRYHQIGEGSRDPMPATFDEAKDMLRSKLRQAVSLRLRSDVPVGAYLSGGIDSSVVAHLTDGLRSERLKTFSIAFTDPRFDESRYQAMMTSRLKVDCFTLTVDDCAIRENFEAALYHTERPVFRTAPVPLHLLAKAVRDSGIRVVLTGEGADEVLWGYDAFKELKLLRHWAHLPPSRRRTILLRKLYPHLAHYSNSAQVGLLRMFYEGFLSSYDNALVGLNMRVHNNRVLANYLHQDHRLTVDDDWLIPRIRAILPDHWDSLSLLQRNQVLEMRTLLQGYLLSSQGDRMSLAHGIEGRYPFLDHELVEWLFHLPDGFKLPRMSQKHLLRETFRPDLPSEIIDRPKQPYQAPDLKAFFPDGVLCEMARHHLSPEAIRAAGLFDEQMVARLLAKWSRGVPENVGYRDNMVFTFLLSTQIVASQAKTRTQAGPPSSPKTIDIRNAA